MSLNSKFIHTFIGLFLGLMGFVACTPPPPPPIPPTPSPTPRPTATTIMAVITATVTPRPTQPTPPPQTASLTVWAGLPPAQSEQLQQDLAAFHAEYPHLQIDLQHYDNPDEFTQELLIDQTPFDVVLVSPPLLHQLWLAQRLAPMSDFFSEAFIDNFAGVTLSGASREGQLWGLPKTAGFHLMLFYQRDEVETPPNTMADLLRQTQDLAEEKGHPVLAMNSYDPLWLIPWLAPYNTWLVDETGQPILNSLGMEAALTNYLTWHQAPGVLPPTSYDKIRKLFVQKQLTFIIDGDWAISELSPVNNLNWGVAPLPSVGSQPPAPLVLAHYWAISHKVKGEQAQAAATFLTFMTRPERQLIWAQQFQQLPTHRAALNDRLILNDSLLHPAATQLLTGHGLMLGVEPNRLLNAMRQPLAQALAHQLTVKEAVEAMQRNIEP